MRGGSVARLAGWIVWLAAAPAMAQTAPAAATLDKSLFPTAGEHATRLRVTGAGRFAIRAASPTGTALQLVDMMTGPTDLAGAAGAVDGRIDQLLDAGTYKLRLFGAAKAQGETRLSVVAFRAQGLLEPAPRPGVVATGELRDLEQRAFRLTVPPPGRVRIEAAGRSLSDLRLWRDGTDLAPIETAARTIEPTRGHPLTDLVLEGTVEAGAYLVTAYGGPALSWPDGGEAEPLHLRVGSPPDLADGWAHGRIGPFGSEIYEVGPDETSFRLDLPEPAPVELKVSVENGMLAQAAIAKNSREPNATVNLAAGKSGKRLVEIAGAEGQVFSVRGFRLTGSRSVAAPGDWWVAAATIGFGGDELPATALLLRSDPKAGRVPIASSAPRVGPDQAWRRRFNLRGPSSLLIEVAEAGPIAVRATGLAVQPAFGNIGGESFGARAEGAAAWRWELEPGWYLLRLNPVGGASGPLDLTVGPPELVPERPGANQPAAPVLALGRQLVAPGQSLTLLGGSGPGAAIDLLARTLPAALEPAPLTVTVAARETLQLPVRLPATGSLAATVIGEGGTAAELRDPHDEGATRVGTSTVVAADHVRTVILAWHPPEAAAPPSVAPPPPTPLAAGRPRFFDLAKDEERSFGLAIAEGGLYRVETLGRLETEGWIGTPFVAAITHEAANGHGHNVLLQSYLRAGRYRVTVAARQSAGRVGILADPAPLRVGGTLLPGGSVRATMPAGSGVAFPIEIGAAARYHLDLVGLARKFTARLEDAEGWPILPAGDLSSLDRTLSAGRYRVLVLPQAVDARVVARLSLVEPEAELQGHGPHPLRFDAEQHFQWREPAGRDEPRVPDQWDFALSGPAHVTIEISDGMAAELRRADASAGPAVARLLFKSGFAGKLPAGRYRIAAKSLGRNDRLDYSLSLRSEELQPGRPRSVALPATVPFAIAADRVVSLTSFGDVDVKAVLRDGDGRVLGRYDDRVDDWNIAVSRYLPAGRYRLELSQVAPPPATPAAKANDAASDETEKEAETEETPAAEPTGGRVELRLALPDAADTIAAPAAGAVTLQGTEVHRLAVPPAAAGELIVAAAVSSAEVVLSLERRDPHLVWRSEALDQDRAPVVAIPADGDASRRWRVSVWTVDGGPESVRFAVRSIAAEAQPLGAVAPAPLALDGIAGGFRAALVAVSGSGLVRLGTDPTGILAGSAPGQALRPVEGRIIVPQSDRVWLLARDHGASTLPLSVLVPEAAEPIALTVPAEGTATLPAAPMGNGRLTFWLAQSGLGQPGLAAGHGMGVTAGSAFALAGSAPLQVWNAGDGDSLHLRIERFDLRLLPERQAEPAVAATLPAASVLPLRLPAGGKRLRIDLPAGAAAVAGWHDAEAVTAWTGGTASSWLLDGRWDDVLLVNPSPRPLPATLSAAPLAAAPAVLRPGAAEKRFFGAAGALSLPYEARPGSGSWSPAPRLRCSPPTAGFVAAG